MTLYYIETDDPHWVPSDAEEHVYQFLGVRVTYTPGVDPYKWDRQFEPYNDQGVELSYLFPGSSIESGFGDLFPEGPPIQDPGKYMPAVFTPSPGRMDLSKTSILIDSSIVTIDQITV